MRNDRFSNGLRTIRDDSPARGRDGDLKRLISPTTWGKSPVTKAWLEGHGGQQGTEHGQTQQSSQEERQHRVKRVLQVSKRQEAGRRGQRFSSAFIQLPVLRCFWEKGEGGHGSFIPF